MWWIADKSEWTKRVSAVPEMKGNFFYKETQTWLTLRLRIWRFVDYSYLLSLCVQTIHGMYIFASASYSDLTDLIYQRNYFELGWRREGLYTVQAGCPLIASRYWRVAQLHYAIVDIFIKCIYINLYFSKVTMFDYSPYHLNVCFRQRVLSAVCRTVFILVHTHKYCSE